MAEQKGLLSLKGRIGKFSFYETKDGFSARERKGIDGKRIARDPKFQRTRENGQEFGRACKAGKVLRYAFRELVKNSADRKMTNRLTSAMMQVIKNDSSNERGKRNVIDGEAELLTGFEFNETAKLAATLIASYTANIDRIKGELSVVIPGSIPSKMVKAPLGATHFSIVSAGAAIDFEKESFELDSKSTEELPLDGKESAVINLVNTITANSAHPLFLVLGILFYQEVRGVKCSLNSSAFNPMALVKVAGI